jgi:hypothetical protein
MKVYLVVRKDNTLNNNPFVDNKVYTQYSDADKVCTKNNDEYGYSAFVVKEMVLAGLEGL